ncbi:flagellar motor switch phosphatase FliY [Brevibacillus fluminis]|uniref:Flagellar motor switch phosphatase FliY n=1 Tax=Brevibacillus fluminis TaxID=511487 RepID=A0A3M8DWH2_9BACL|nr:flagellar motor switch phosphatase FliY [Brevibacillus fluminis]RNB91869.1 flagellar motor switch phosphatase FliY [Brevibacillus fluminis]
MSRDMLSQEEIDALLRANNLVGDEEEPENNNDDTDITEFLTAFEQDALGEIGNISFGSAATALSTLLGQKVDITTPTVSIIKRSTLEDEFPRPHVAVHVEYTDGFQGINLLVIRVDDAAIIADLMMGGDGRPATTDLSEMHVSAVQEAMNQMMGSAATSMSTIFNKLVNISPPGIDIWDLSQPEGKNNIPDVDFLVKISFRLMVGEHGELIDSSIMQLLPVPFAKQMLDMLMGGASAAEPAATPEPAISAPTPSPEPAWDNLAPVAATAEAVRPPVSQQPPVQPPAMQQPGMQPPMYGQPQMDPYAQQYQMQPPPGYPPYPYPPYPYPPQYQQPPAAPPAPQHFGGLGATPQPSASVKPAQFSAFGMGSVPSIDDQNLNLLLDIPLQVTVELGRTKKVIKDILELSAGSIIQLDKLAGEPVDILVNNKLVAKGEVVVIDENFGVRVTDIISQWDRVQKLQ